VGRRRDAETLPDEITGRQIDEGAFDRGTADIHANRQF
jgi:hypothetical protein